jgi:glutathione S-transferase
MKQPEKCMEIVGRRSSVFTRMPLIFAETFGVPYTFVAIHDMKDLDPAAYAGNPALKMPALRRNGSLLLGALNICRAIAEAADAQRRVVWPEELRDDESRTAQELVWHCMTAQVQMVMGTVLGKLPVDNVFFVKTAAGLTGSLRWLEQHLEPALQRLPASRDLSVLEMSLLCLVEHLEFRPTVALTPYPRLVNFSRAFAAVPAIQHTAYRFDSP